MVIWSTDNRLSVRARRFKLSKRKMSFDNPSTTVHSLTAVNSGLQGSNFVYSKYTYTGVGFHGSTAEQMAFTVLL